MTIAAFDSRVYEYLGSSGKFSAPIGAGVRIEDEAGFWRAYAEVVDQQIDSFNLPRHRFVYNAYHLFDTAGPIKGKAILEKIVENLLPEVSEVLVCFCIIPRKAVPSIEEELEDGSVNDVPVVNQYWEDGPAIQVPIVKFMQLIPNYYPVICASQYATLHPNERNSTVLLLDNVHGPDNNSWRSISEWNVSISPSGDAVSPPIAFADLVIRLLDLRLKNTKSRLGIREIESNFSEIDKKLQIVWTGPSCLADMAPATRRDMNLSDRITRPRILAIGKTNHLALRGLRKILEGIGAWDPLCNLAASIKGCLKVFEQTRVRDLRNTTSGDIIACYEQSGFETAKLLDNYKDIRIIDITKPESWSPEMDNPWYEF